MKRIGVVLIQSYIKGIGYQIEDIKVLEFVAQHIATALTRVRAIEETRQRNAELAIINSVQTALASELDFQSIVDSVGDKLTEIFSGENLAIGLLDKASGMVKLPYLFENKKRIENAEFPLGEKGLTAHVAKTLKPLLINSNFDKRSAEFGTISVSNEPNPKSWLGVPIILNGEYIGGFALQNWDHENAYTNSHVRLLQTLAGNLGVALENARLFKAEQERVAELAVINSVQEGLASKLDMQDIYNLVGDKIRRYSTSIQLPSLAMIARTSPSMVIITWKGTSLYRPRSCHLGRVCIRVSSSLASHYDLEHNRNG